MELPLTLTDPYGLRIEITESLCSLEEAASTKLKLYNDYRSVIERPAFVIDLIAAKQPTRYYFRSVGWGTKLLIRVEKWSGEWQANQCSKNPSDSFLHNLAKQGNLLSPMNED